VVICLERGADLHRAQLMPLPLTVSCFSKIQTGFTFLVPAHPGSPGQRAAKQVCVCVKCYFYIFTFHRTFPARAYGFHAGRCVAFAAGCVNRSHRPARRSRCSARVSATRDARSTRRATRRRRSSGTLHRPSTGPRGEDRALAHAVGPSTDLQDREPAPSTEARRDRSFYRS